jgi:hypothetical protein
MHIASAQSPGFPIFSVYRDAAWLENITAVAQSLSWDTQVSESAEIPINGTNTSFDLSVWGHYLVMYSVPVRSTWGGNRSEIQSWLRLNGTEDLEYSYASSYIRRVDGDDEWYNEWAAVVNVSAGDDIELRIQKTDSNTATIQRTPDRSGINILKLDDEWDYTRLRPSASQAITTSWSDVNLGTTDELDIASFWVSWNDITLAGAWKYLVTYSVAAETTGTNRTNNEIRLTLSWAEVEATRSTTYIRAQNGSFTGIASYVGIIESTISSQILNLEIRRESTLAGTTNNTVPAKTGITITKLPDDADYVRIWETIWGQDITTTANTPLTFDTTIEQGIDLEHDNINTSEIDINSSWDYLFLHSIYNAQNFLNNASRENPYLEWQVSGTTLPYWVSGSYNRHSNDGNGDTESSHSSAGVILTWLNPGDTVELTETNEASNWGSTYKWGFMGIQWVSLSSLFSGGGYFSQNQYRWRDDVSDFDVNAWWLAAENTDITDIEKGETLRLRMKVENPGDGSYDSVSQFEVQWARTAGSCNGGLPWTSMDVSWDDWEMADSSHISPNAESSSTQLLTNAGWNTHILSEWYHSPNGHTLSTSAGVFTSTSQKEYEFSMKPTQAALSSISYCFRLYDIAETKVLEINNYAKAKLVSNAVILDDAWWEAGKVNAPENGAWTTISFAGWPYTTPVIVGRTNTYNDGNEALVFEAQNVTSTWAQVRLCDSNAWNATGCQAHIAETIGYIVVDASQTNSVDGIEAGTFVADESFDTAGWLITTSYTETFSAIPYVFTSIQTTTGDSPIVTRLTSSDLTGFTWGICQQNSTDWCNASHPNETFGWIAIDPTLNPFLRDMDIGSLLADGFSWTWMPVTFSTSFESVPIWLTQAVTNNGGQDVQVDEIQSVTTAWMDIRACELDNDDDCDTHNPDTLVWLAIEEWVFATEFLLDETHYRWYENNGLNTPSVAAADENNILTSIPWSGELRLRMLIQNADPDLPASSLGTKLQYASGSLCSWLTWWNDVWPIWGSEDWILHDNPGLADGVTLSSSLLFWGGHKLQTYSESLPASVNPSPIAAWEYGEWDFSLIKNIVDPTVQYCFRAVTQNDDEISYSSYAQIDTTDAVDPVISSYSPNSGSLLPIGNFNIAYNFTDADSGINTSSSTIYLQKWDGSIWWSDIAGTYLSLDSISISEALYTATAIPYWKYRAGFEILDNAGNNTFVLHEFYIDAIEFTISRSELDIGNVDQANVLYTSSDEIIITVKTLWAAFDVSMIDTTQLSKSGENIATWDGVKWYGYELAPYTWTQLPLVWTVVIWWEAKNLNIDWWKNTYEYRVKYSILTESIFDYSAGDYEWLIDFWINLSYD